MSNIEVRGKQEFMDMEIPVVEGGFGEGQKAILAKTIAKIHDMRMDKVNALINDNIDEFEFGVDILDLKSIGFENLSKVSELFTQNGFKMFSRKYVNSLNMHNATLEKVDKYKDVPNFGGRVIQFALFIL